jgi:catechol 2,3-dioxygenase-like lactoylglutathione lyase family enzyme
MTDENSPAPLAGINHVALVTADLDRLLGFYCDTLGATCLSVHPVPFGRMGIVRFGEGGCLNIFQVDGNEHSDAKPGMFTRGHIDHLGIDATDACSFLDLRRRLIERGAATEDVTDFGPAISLMFTDPDGMEGEICLMLDWETEDHEPRPFDIERLLATV